jgi:hypothetical protein
MPSHPPPPMNWDAEFGPLEREWDELQSAMRAINIEAQSASATEGTSASGRTPSEVAASAENEWHKLEQSLFGETAPGLARGSASNPPAPEITRASEKAIEPTPAHKHQTHSSRPQTRVHWFYALGEKREGPVAQAKLLELLENEELAWTALIWRQPMKEWKPAMETELADLAGLGTPPPLPPPTQLRPPQ